jgi:inosine-uridine nucleoside N-ribohydrolase
MLIARLAGENPGIDLLCLGPLTNIALAIKVEPNLPSLIGRVVIMGGVLLERFPFRGNITPLAEFNFWVDPDAAHEVLNSGLRCEVVPLNVCAGFFFNRDIADGWLKRDDPLGEAFRTVFEGAFHRIPNLSVPMYDQIAAIAFLEPKLFTWEYFNNITVVRGPDIHQGMCSIKSSLLITPYGSLNDTKDNLSNVLTSRRLAVATGVDRSSLYNFLIKLTQK